MRLTRRIQSLCGNLVDDEQLSSPTSAECEPHNSFRSMATNLILSIGTPVTADKHSEIRVGTRAARLQRHRLNCAPCLQVWLLQVLRTKPLDHSPQIPTATALECVSSGALSSPRVIVHRLLDDVRRCPTKPSLECLGPTPMVSPGFCLECDLRGDFKTSAALDRGPGPPSSRTIDVCTEQNPGGS
jgi:hypothetical protein